MNSLEIVQDIASLLLKSISISIQDNFLKKYSLVYYSKVASETQKCLSKNIRSSEIPTGNFINNCDKEPVI